MPALWQWPPVVTANNNAGGGEVIITSELALHQRPVTTGPTDLPYFRVQYNLDTHVALTYPQSISSIAGLYINGLFYNGALYEEYIASLNGYQVLAGIASVDGLCNFYTPDAPAVGVVQSAVLNLTDTGRVQAIRAQGVDTWGLYVHGSEPLIAATVSANDKVGLFATDTYIRIMYTERYQSGTSMGQPVYSHRTPVVTFNVGPRTFTNKAILWVGGSGAVWDLGVLHVLDAGEGFAYLVTSEDGVYAMRSVNFNAATPVVSAAIAAVPASVARAPHTRYINTNGQRTFLFHDGTQFTRMTFTTAARNTPTFTNTTVAAPSGTPPALRKRHLVVEYDPLQTGKAYLVEVHLSGVRPCLVWMAALDALNPAAGWTPWYDAASLLASSGINTGAGTVAHSRMLGDAGYDSFCVVSGYINFGLPNNVSVRWSCWNTPQALESALTIDNTYQDASAGSLLTKERGVSIGGDYQSVQVGGSLSSTLGGTFRWSFGEGGDLASGVVMGRDYQSVSATLAASVVFNTEFTQHWSNCGTTWMDGFSALVDAERALFGLPPLIKLRSDGKYLTHRDIAVMQAQNFVRYRVFDHDSPDLPVGQQTFAQRKGLMPANGGAAENLQAQFRRHLPTGTVYAYPTPQVAFDVWKASPSHYANIIRDWGTNNDHVYSLIGIAEGLSAYTLGEAYDPYVMVYMAHVFAVLEDRMIETYMNQYWDNAGALVGFIDQTWSNSAYTHVAARHEIRYALRVAAAHEGQWGCRVAQEHVSPVTYRAAVEHVSPYDRSMPLGAYHEATYAIRDTVPVVRGHAAVWSFRVAAQSAATYALLTPATAQHLAGYSIKSVVGVTAEHASLHALRVAAQLAAAWTVNTTAARQHEAAYGDLVGVAAEHNAGYHILPYSPVLLQHTAYYGMSDPASVVPNGGGVWVTLHTGARFRAMDGVLENGEGDVGYRFECRVDRLEVFHQIIEDQPVQVDFCGEVYDLLVSAKSTERAGPGEVALRLTANSPAERLKAPYVADISYVQEADATAYELIDSLIEIDFTYEIVDWAVPAGRLQADGASPLAVVQQVADAAGGVVDSNPDGSLRIRLPYPQAMDTLGLGVVDQVYTDDADNLSMKMSTEYRDGANSFRVREGDDSFRDSLEWEKDEQQTDPLHQTGLLKAYLSPYRPGVAIVHLGGAEFLTQLGEVDDVEEEMVEFNEGTGNTRRPIASIQTVEWVTPSLGSPAFAAFSTLINVGTTVNAGYGLAKVTYTTRYLAARAGGIPATVTGGSTGPVDAYAYFILEDSNG